MYTVIFTCVCIHLYFSIYKCLFMFIIAYTHVRTCYICMFADFPSLIRAHVGQACHMITKDCHIYVKSFSPCLCLCVRVFVSVWIHPYVTRKHIPVFGLDIQPHEPYKYFHEELLVYTPLKHRLLYPYMHCIHTHTHVEEKKSTFPSAHHDIHTHAHSKEDKEDRSTSTLESLCCTQSHLVQIE